MSSNMTVVFLGEQKEIPDTLEKSILVMGPGPDKDGRSWKVAQALPALENAGFDGVVFIMEPRPDENGITPKIPLVGGYASLAREEHMKSRMADVHLAWLPDARDADSYNTRLQIGKSLESGKLVLGAPEGGLKTQYALAAARQHGVPVGTTLDEAVAKALRLLGDGAERSEGERFVPPYVWHTPHFQQWYGNLKLAGNRLDFAEVVWKLQVGPNQEITFFWILHPKIWITAEGRYKDNEVVLARPDVSVTVLYRLAERLDDCEVILIKEFRTPVSNPTGYVWENPGGSSWEEGVDPLECASEEVREEINLVIAASRFSYYGRRQIAPTLSAHMGYLFAACVTDEEMTKIEAEVGVAHGVIEDTERTYAVKLRVGDIRNGELVGWGDEGMILHVLTRVLGL